MTSARHKDKRYRVLMLGWEFPPHISGGLGTACYGLTRHMTRLGTEVLFVMPCAEAKQDYFDNFSMISADKVTVSTTEEMLQEEIHEHTVECIPIDSPLSPYLSEVTYQQHLGRLQQQQEGFKKPKPPTVGCLDFTGAYGPTLLSEVRRFAVVATEVIKAHEFDVLHAHDWMTFPAAVEAKRLTGKPLICHIHATEYDRAGLTPDTRISAIERLGLHAADLVITVSQRSKDLIVKHYEVPPEKIRVVHNAVNKDRPVSDSVCPTINRKRIQELRVQKDKSNRKTVLFLGRVTSQKGPDYFIDAAKLVLHEMDNVRFVMAGSGDLLPRMVERVAAEHLQDRFHFTGFLRGEEVEQIYAMSDVYVMPSVSEPFGITPFEAMAYEVPIIVSCQSGITEVLTHAIKVDFWDVHQLAESILEILQDPDLAKRLALAGAAELEKISWDVAAVSVLKTYEELLGR
ncbi:hypothetical protein BVY04_00380 [bacterium M21]|nr:hypothetical protein BVY04_00380 [bacterium M21]